MLAYGFEFSEKIHPCERCGFLCFDDEMYCPNCMKERGPLLSDDASICNRQKSDYRKKYSVLKKASKRGRIINTLFFLTILVAGVSGFYFQYVGHWVRAAIVMSAILILTAIPYVIFFGTPGTVNTRIGSYLKLPQYKYAPFTRFGTLSYFKGLLRYFSNNHIVILVALFTLFTLITIFITYVMGPYWQDYYRLYSSMLRVDETTHTLVTLAAHYTINVLAFLGYFLYVIFCPYDYQLELNRRKDFWKNQTT